MTAQLSPNPIFRSWDNLGFPLVGGKLNTYAAGTTNPQATYTDSTQTTPNTNPVILNFRGEAQVWLDPTLTYKFVLTDAFNNLIWTVDNIQGPLLIIYPIVPAETNASVIPTNYNYPPGNVLRYGADPSGVTDSTTAIQSALRVGLPVHFPANAAGGFAIYQVTNALNCTVKGQMIYGDGRFVSIVHCPPSFNLSATGLFVISPGEEGPEIRDLWIDADQSGVKNVGTRANLIAYPWAIYGGAAGRWSVRNVRITGFPQGLFIRNLGGSSVGGILVDTLEMGSYTMGIDIDGGLDTIRILNWHSWTFCDYASGGGTGANMSTNQQAIYNDGGNTAGQSGRCDGLVIDNFACINAGIGLRFYYSTGTFPGFTLGSINNSDFDSYGGLKVEAGILTVSDTFFTVGVINTSYCVNQTGGVLEITDCWLSPGQSMTTPLISVSSDGTSQANLHQGATVFELSNSDVITPSEDQSCVSTSTVNAGSIYATVNGNLFQVLGTAMTNISLNFTGNTNVMCVGNKFTPASARGASVVALGVDNASLLAHNDFGNRSITLPNPFSQIKVSENFNLFQEPTKVWSLDKANDNITLANGANAALPNGSGLILVTEYTNGSSALYICGSAGAALVSNTPTNFWVASTTTPAAGKLSVAFNGSNGYAIYNNIGASVIVGVVSLRTRPNT